MSQRTTLSGRCCLFALLVFFAGIVAVPSARADASGAEVTAIVVKFRDNVTGSNAPQMTMELKMRLAAMIHSGFAEAGQTKDGAFRIVLNPPLTIDEARAAINRVRMDTGVLYASLSASPFIAPYAKAEAKTASQSPPTNRLIVKYKDAAITDAARAGRPLAPSEINRLSAVIGEPAAFLRAMHDGASVVTLIRRHSIEQVEAIAARIAQQPDIEFAQPDYIDQALFVPNDPCYQPSGLPQCAGGYQWNLFDSVGGANVQPAWALSTGSASIVVAVIDTGVLFNHPDLSGRLIGGYDFIDDALFANDNAPNPMCSEITSVGCLGSRDADASDPGDWLTTAEVTNSSNWFYQCVAQNSSFHGTHVAGIIGASGNNGVGVTGINWVSRILPVRVLGCCGGYVSDIADAIVWASGGTVSGVPPNANPARVLNLSLGHERSPGSCDAAYQTAINSALSRNAVIVIAAGNANEDAGRNAPGNCAGVITVAATGQTGFKAYYSNFGSYVEIAAPGGDGRFDSSYNPSAQGILSTLNSGATAALANGYNYSQYQGTSVAAPHVAGIASLMLSARPTLTSAQVLSLMQTNARRFPTGAPACNTAYPPGPSSTWFTCTCTTALCGAGIVDAAAAVQQAKNRNPPAKAGARRDFNFDADTDITWTNSATGEKLMWLMNGGTIAGGGSLLTDPNWTITHYGDFNGDAKTDLVWHNFATGETVIWLMDGRMILSGASLLTSTVWNVIKVGDFNGDGNSDLLWRNSVTGELAVWLMNGTTFIGGAGIPFTNLNFLVSHVADFNGDGKDDLVVRDTSTGYTSIWFMNGTSVTFGSPIIFDPGFTATHVGDFNGDGRPDVVWRHTTGLTAIAIGLSSPVVILSDPNWRVKATDDLNGDGKSDLLWLNTATGTTAAWLMDGTGLVAGSGLLGANWQITRTGDFNGDGKADILWTNTSTNEKVMWLMNGLSPTSGYLLSNDPDWSIDP